MPAPSPDDRNMSPTSANSGDSESVELGNKKSNFPYRSLIVIVVVLVVCWQIYKTMNQPPSVPEQIKAMVAEREKFDKTVWADEVEAQKYEQTFVQLWDDLRNTRKPLQVLKNFKFNGITLPESPNVTALDWEIALTQFKEAGTNHAHNKYTKIIDDFIQQGYRLEESEWHHSSYESNGDNQPTSVVSVKLHVLNKKTQKRFIVSCKLKVKWTSKTDQRGNYLADRLVVKDLKILSRKSPPVFDEAATATSRPNQYASAHPIIMYDLNRDGKSEILIPRWNRVYRYEDEKFQSSKLFQHPEKIWETGIVADFDGDTLADFITVSKSGHPILFPGSGSRYVTSASKQCADASFEMPSAMTAGDVDGDGDLDLFISQYKLSYQDGQMPTPIYDAIDGYPSYLLINDGKGNFSDATEKSGLAKKRRRRTYSCSLVDLDDDQDLDLIVVSDYAGIDLYENDGEGVFVETTEKWIGERHLFGMAHTFSDYNQDGKLDFYAIGMSSTTARRLHQMKLNREDRPDIGKMRMAMGYGNLLYYGADGGKFERPAKANSIARTGWSWGVSSFDFDNDGDKDIYVANGHRSGKSSKDYCTKFWCHDIYTGNSMPDVAVAHVLSDSLKDLNQSDISWNGFEHNVLWMNIGSNQFTNVAYLMGVGFEYDSRAVVTDDIDHDGRVDLFLSESHYHAEPSTFSLSYHFYRNEFKNNKHWIGIQLQEEKKRSPIGARIEIETPQGKQYSRIVTGDSFFSQHANTAHFGLGTSTTVKKIKVTWLDGKSKFIENPAIDQYHLVRP